MMLFLAALSQFEFKLQLDRVFWPNVTTCSVVTQQRRSHAPDIKNPIGVCPRRIGAPKREAYQSIETHLQKRAVSFDQGCQFHASDLLDYPCSEVIFTLSIIELW